MTPANDNPPRLLSRTEAAAYCGFKPTAFATHVLAGRLPPAVIGLRKWDKKVLDEHLDRLSGIAVAGSPAEPVDPWGEWKASNAG